MHIGIELNKGFLNNSIYIAVLIIQRQEKHLKPLNMLNFEEHLIVNN